MWSRPSGRACPAHASRNAGRSKNAAVGDRGVDPRQVLEDRPAGAEVEVADLGVAHLARRQPDGVLGGPEAWRAATRRGARARSASARRRWRRRPGRCRCRTRRGPRGRSGGARPAGRCARRRRRHAAGSSRGGEPGTRDDAGHLVGLERGAADERAVDRRLGQELVDVRRRDAAAVEDRHGLAPIVREPDPRRARARIAPAIAAASEPLAFRPVPIAQTGS